MAAQVAKLKPAFYDAFFVVFGEPEGKVEELPEECSIITDELFDEALKEAEQLDISFLRDYAQDEIFTTLQKGHRQRGLLIRLLLKWAFRKPPLVTINLWHGRIIDIIRQYIIYKWADYSFSLYFCWFNVESREFWKEKPDFKLTYDGYERNSASFKKNDIDRKKAIVITDRILDIMAPLVDKQQPRTRLNCWMDDKNIKIEITNE